jgi:lysylphosphatidylglycerol synthetase-like protein (DUF2156 family)
VLGTEKRVSNDQLTPVVPVDAKSVTDTLVRLLDESAAESGQRTILAPYPWKVIFSDDKTGFVSLMEGSKALVTWRSPVGTPEVQREIMGKLARYSQQTKKALYCLGMNEICREAGEECGLLSLRVGAEASFDLSTWTTAGRKRQNIRLNCNYATGLGVTWREAFPRTSEDDRKAIAFVEHEWEKDRPARHTDTFLRTAYTDLIEYRRYFIAELNGIAQAVTTCTPISKRGWYLQDITRLPDSPRGSLEGAMILALNTFKEEGFEFATNGLLPDDGELLKEAGKDQGLGFFGNSIIKFFDHRYQFGGISKFRSKFSPDQLEVSYLVRSKKSMRPRAVLSLIKLLT